ncbi:hypothetical protein LshimejAT787_1300660 [Lyophyllum shimeji]|uniref:Uncharacterized protein n=1 Tax=Lyophyllum shimeji TaxID=47721 RepID=A0A9P3UT34_LYOSH|nr:hypothetical protein LshimejAT787_1300580 [Lyophyllum shimeji]GLB43165.1 hypothetical protein LshimejAT787_1300660 [Lyophyllum shimeji]
MLHCDEDRSPPIFNYARFLPWARSANGVLQVFRAAQERAEDLKKSEPAQYGRRGSDGATEVEVDSGAEAENSKENHCVTVKEVNSYATELVRQCGLGQGIWFRFLIVSLFSLALQWGTVGGGIVAEWLSPTKGLGCRSGSYVLYATVGTIIWLLLVLSSFLSYYHSCNP